MYLLALCTIYLYPLYIPKSFFNDVQMYKLQQKSHFKQGDFRQTSLTTFQTVHHLIFSEIQNTSTNCGEKNLERV